MIFELINLGVGTYGVGGALINASNVLKLQEDIRIDLVPSNGSLNAISSNSVYHAVSDLKTNKSNLQGGNVFDGNQTFIGLSGADPNRLSIETDNGGSVRIVFGTLDNEVFSSTTLVADDYSVRDNTVILPEIDGKLALLSNIPAQFNPIAGTNITLSGTYPNITFNASGGSGGIIDAVPTDGSANGVSSNGVFEALALKQDKITLTTTGVGAATLIGDTLNIPNNSGGGGSQDLQSVTELGNTTNKALVITRQQSGPPGPITTMAQGLTIGNYDGDGSSISYLTSKLSGSRGYSTLSIGGGIALGEFIFTSNGIDLFGLYERNNGNSACFSVKVSIGSLMSPTEALDVTGKARVSVAPTNPTDVVRLQDLSNYVTVNGPPQAINGFKTYTNLAGLEMNSGFAPITSTFYKGEGIQTNIGSLGAVILFPPNKSGTFALTSDITDITNIPYLSLGSSGNLVIIENWGSSNTLVLGVNAVLGNITITLPPVAIYRGKMVYIKRMDGSTNTVTINGNGTNIDGAPTLLLPTQYSSAKIFSNGTQHLIL